LGKTEVHDERALTNHALGRAKAERGRRLRKFLVFSSRKAKHVTNGYLGRTQALRPLKEAVDNFGTHLQMIMENERKGKVGGDHLRPRLTKKTTQEEKGSSPTRQTRSYVKRDGEKLAWSGKD